MSARKWACRLVYSTDMSVRQPPVASTGTSATITIDAPLQLGHMAGATVSGTGITPHRPIDARAPLRGAGRRWRSHSGDPNQYYWKK